jgi:hypothetical protein
MRWTERLKRNELHSGRKPSPTIKHQHYWRNLAGGISMFDIDLFDVKQIFGSGVIFRLLGPRNPAAFGNEITAI